MYITCFVRTTDTDIDTFEWKYFSSRCCHYLYGIFSFSLRSIHSRNVTDGKNETRLLFLIRFNELDLVYLITYCQSIMKFE